jgi:hypothetical protein
VTQYANELHERLSKVDLNQGIAMVTALVQQRGYQVMFHDPGVRAWVANNQEELRRVATLRRQARQQQNAFGFTFR